MIDLRRIPPRRSARTTNQDIALGHGIDLSVGTFQRRHQQGATSQALGIADRGNGHVDILAGPTGAAFTNLILCPRGATAIIMTTTHGSRAGFFSGLAAPLEQRVIYLHGPGTDPNQTISPFSVDIADVRRLLSQLRPIA